MRPPLGTVLATALACALASLAGCGEQDPSDGTGSATTTPTPSTATPSDPTTSTPTTNDPTVPPSDGLEKVRVVGEVTSVGDCVVVQDDNAITWTVTGPRTGDLVRGDRVQVIGAPDLAATGCGGPVVRAVRVDVLAGG